MWSASAVFLLPFAVLLGLPQIGTCKKCYACVGLSKEIPFTIPMEGLLVSGDCVDPVNTSKMPTMDCDQSGFSCVKGVTNLPNNIQLMMRACMPADECKKHAEECQVCDGNLCNTSSHVVPSITAISVLSLLLAKYYYF